MEIMLQAIHVGSADKYQRSRVAYERTNLSLLTQPGFFGLKVMNLFQRTWATGAIPMGAPGWPEFASAVAST